MAQWIEVRHTVPNLKLCWAYMYFVDWEIYSVQAVHVKLFLTEYNPEEFWQGIF